MKATIAFGVREEKKRTTRRKRKVAANFPVPTSTSRSGSVRSDSSVPCFFSSAHSPIATAGMKIRRKIGAQSKKSRRFASPLTKKSERKIQKERSEERRVGKE